MATQYLKFLNKEGKLVTIATHPNAVEALTAYYIRKGFRIWEEFKETVEEKIDQVADEIRDEIHEEIHTSLEKEAKEPKKRGRKAAAGV